MMERLEWLSTKIYYYSYASPIMQQKKNINKAAVIIIIIILVISVVLSGEYINRHWLSFDDTYRWRQRLTLVSTYDIGIESRKFENNDLLLLLNFSVIRTWEW